MSHIWSYVVLSMLIVFAYCESKQLASNAPQYVEATVYVDRVTSKATLKLGAMDKEHGTAYGFYNNTVNATGWSVLEISSTADRQLTDAQLMYATGFLEGFLTASQIWQNFVNIRAAILDNKYVSKLTDFYAQQDNWTRSMILSHPAEEDAFWRHVSYVLAQFDGLYDGYKMAAEPDADTSLFVVQFLNGVGDFIDLRHAIDPVTRPNYLAMTNEQFRSYIATSGHCSALVKVTPGFENFFMSHSSWFIFASTMRIYKHYHFAVSDPDTATHSLSFSSYPGFLESLDDFYLLDSGLVLLQTTNNVFNTWLYDLITPQSLFAWQRVRVANMMSDSGHSWYHAVARYNSGTYNNQYMVVDLKRVSLTESLADGTLWVVEQIPGLVVGKDQTEILRTGYWPSYNVPFYEVIYNLSGYPDIVKRRGVDFSYQLAPRAKIFRRDQSSVVDLETLKELLRYNDYIHDVYSKADPWNTICSRGDLATSQPTPNGCYDTKVADCKMARRLASEIINGPTTSHNLPAFSWSKFPNATRDGLPDVYDFSWISAQPVL